VAGYVANESHLVTIEREFQEDCTGEFRARIQARVEPGLRLVLSLGSYLPERRWISSLAGKGIPGCRIGRASRSMNTERAVSYVSVRRLRSKRTSARNRETLTSRLVASTLTQRAISSSSDTVILCRMIPKLRWLGTGVNGGDRRPLSRPNTQPYSCASPHDVQYCSCTFLPGGHMSADPNRSDTVPDNLPDTLPDTIERSLVIEAPPGRVWSALTEARHPGHLVRRCRGRG